MAASQTRVNKSSVYKTETKLMLGLCNKLQPMLPKIAQLIFDEDGLEKPTQNLFNNISYYLIFLIDSQAHASLTWPLYDTKAERAFRSEFSRFISEYAAKGLLTDLRPSYLVHPSCYKVSILIHQLTLLAVKGLLIPRVKDTNKQILFDEVTDKYSHRSEDKSFVDYMDRFNFEDKLSNFLCRKQQNERIAEMLCKRITECESKLATLNPQGYIDRLIDGFISKHELDETSRSEILKIKNVNEPATVFDDWLREVDKQLDDIEASWDDKVLPLMKKCTHLQQLSEEIIKRHTGQIDRSCYTLTYDPKHDEICTDDLQNQVNSQQKYILRNLQHNGRLNFPNLIRAFLISICYILKNNTFGDEICHFNEHIGVGKSNYSEVKSALRALIKRVFDAEKKLQSIPASINTQTVSIEEHLQIPPLPDLSCLKMNQNSYHTNFDTFTPLNLSKHRFNLHRRGEVFARPQPKSLLTTHHAPKDDFLKTLLSCRVSTYDHASISQNMSVISNIKVNETIAECSSGFTRQQITRLLSTNKKSSFKKLKSKQEHHDKVKIKSDELFNKSMASDSHGLFRSYSSPNLLENRESRIPIHVIRGRKLSIMQEDSPPDISGITCLDSFNTPTGLDNAESSRNTLNLPKMSVEVKNRLDNIAMEFEDAISPILEQDLHSAKAVPARDIARNNIPSINIQESHSKSETPKNNALIKKSSSLEKIINRFKQFRSNSIPHKDEDIKTIVEEKENFNMNVGFTANRNLLPDLLSPSCSLLSVKSNNEVNYVDPVEFVMDEVEHRYPRVSLGTMLGVDHTFLDQFDLAD